MRTPSRTAGRAAPISVVLVAVALLAGCGQEPAATSTPPAAPTTAAGTPGSAGPATSAGPTPEASPSAGGTGSCEYVPTGSAARPVDPPSATGVTTQGTVRYVLEMTNGDVTLTLDRAKAPCTVHSFESLVRQGFYADTRCHRLADSSIFILQCGDPTGTGRGGPGYQFANETDGTESYTSGVVAMANAGPNTNGSQFFLVWDDSSSLSPDYTIFGRMDSAGRDVVASMAGEGQDGSNSAGGGKPNNPSEIRSVTRG